MDSNQKFNIAWKRIKEKSDALFGTAEEVTAEDADHILHAAEIDLDDLRRRTYERLYREAQAYWNRRLEPPARLKKALDDLRPTDLPPRSATEARKQAETVIERILRPISPSLPLRFSYSYRGKTVSTRDQSAMDRYREKLRNRIEDKKREEHE